jgi:YVTN family beta-propeller protein
MTILLGAAGAVLAGAALRAGSVQPQTISKMLSAGVPVGHPAEDASAPSSEPPPEMTIDCTGDQPVPLQSPPVSGPFINFESPPLRPLALSANGQKLLAVNTPNNSLLVLETTGLSVIREIPVGLEPVSVAFQPGTNDNIAWVANYVSDSVTVVNVASGAVLDTVGDFDEPVNILFNSSGSHAAVVVQGRGLPQDYTSANFHAGWLIVIDTATRQVVSRTFLDQHTPRAAAYDAANQRLVVAALHSGNGTTVVGHAVVLESNDPLPPFPTPCDVACGCKCVISHSLVLLRDFSPTSALFANDELLGPVYPDAHENPNFPTAPRVQRIVPAQGGGWQSIIELLADDQGNPDPAMVDLMNAEFNATKSAEIIAAILQDRQPQDGRDLVVLDFSNPADPAGLPIVQVVSDVGTTLTGMGWNPATGDVFVSNLQARNLVRHEDQLRGHIVDHQMIRIPAGPQPGDPYGAPVVIDLHAGLEGFSNPAPSGPPGVDPLEEARENSLANPLDIVFDGQGHGFLAALAVDRVASFDGPDGTIQDRLDVGRGPRGLAVNTAGDRLYVFNRTDMSITQLDVSNPHDLLALQSVALFNPEPAEISEGRDFLYSAKFSDNFSSSCALCHVDAHLDHLAWELSDVAGPMQPAPPNLPQMNHPIKGPMVTQSLKGLKNHKHYHWRGDRPTFQDFNPAFDGLLGGAPLPAEDMEAFTAFVDTVVYPPSPFYNRDTTFLEGSLAGPGACGFVANCDNCHRMFHDGALALFPGQPDGGIDQSGPPLLSQLQEVAQLRELHKKLRSDRRTGFGLLHDGRFESGTNENPLESFLLQLFSSLSTPERKRLIAFLIAFQTNVSPTVGWQVRLSGSDGASAVAQAVSDVTVMAGQYSLNPSHADVIAKVFSAGSWQGFHLVDADPQPVFQSDSGAELPLSELAGGLAPSAIAVFTAVPPGTGWRSGVDQDLDCLMDGLDPQPQVINTHDADFDGQVDTADALQFYACSLIEGPLPVECVLFDADCSGSIDDQDFASFLEACQEALPDCNANSVADLVDIFDGVSFDANQDAVPDECQKGCQGAAECADLDHNGLRDDVCTWWACDVGLCESTAVVFADLGGASGSCPPDGAADANDRFHVLNCFSNQNTQGQLGYPCEATPPAAFNVDAGSLFGNCNPDGVCDGHDAFHVLAAFTGESACSCPGGPAPNGASAVRVVGRAGLRLTAEQRRVRPGGVVAVDVTLTAGVADLRGYQLHLDVSGGQRGALKLVDIVVREPGVFGASGGSAPAAWQAFNVATGQMLVGRDQPGLPAPAGAYLATFVYSASRDAAGTFTVAPAERTFLFPTPVLSQIEISGVEAAVLVVAP